MTTGPRRILVTALLAALVGLGLVAVLFGRRPRRGAAAEIAGPAPAPSPVLPPSRRPALSPAPPPPARKRRSGRRALVAGLAALLLLAGGIFANRDILFEPRSSAPDDGRPPTALSLPQTGLGDAPTLRAEAPLEKSPSRPDRPAAVGSDAFTPPESQGRSDAGNAAASPPRPRMKADATAPHGRQDTSDPATAQAGAAPDRAHSLPSSASPSSPAETPRSPGKPVADAAEPHPHVPTKAVGSEAAEVACLSATGRASLGTGLQLVLNDPRIAPATVGRDGSVTFGVGENMRPGADAARLDAAATQLRERAGPPLTVPVPPHDGDVAARGQNPSEPDDRQPFSTGSVSTGALPRTGAGAAEVSGIATILVMRGDTLWSISRRTYGKGRRYTLIHDANPDQVRDPNRIRPGQILVLPRRAAKRG